VPINTVGFTTIISRAVAANALWFIGGDGGAANYLYRSDGTRAGTVRATSKAITAGSASYQPAFRMAAVNGSIYFRGTDGKSGMEAWRVTTGASRGTIAGLVFNDLDRNGKRTSGETAMSGWRVYLDTNNNGKL